MTSREELKPESVATLGVAYDAAIERAAQCVEACGPYDFCRPNEWSGRQTRDAIAKLIRELKEQYSDHAQCAPGNLRAANDARQREWDPTDLITLAYRGNELAGEVGEACNVIKKLERERLGIRGSRETTEHLAEELADVVICTDLIAMQAGINLDAAVRDKFNATSEKYGLATRMGAAVPPQGRGEEALGPVGDLLLYWQGRANALRILDKARDKSDAATLWQADAFEDCATELRAWFKCPSEDRPSAEALGWRLAAIASDDRK